MLAAPTTRGNNCCLRSKASLRGGKRGKVLLLSVLLWVLLLLDSATQSQAGVLAKGQLETCVRDGSVEPQSSPGVTCDSKLLVTLTVGAGQVCLMTSSTHFLPDSLSPTSPTAPESLPIRPIITGNQ